MKVLHVVDCLDRGAVERWLLRMLAHARKQAVPVDWSFYCTRGEPGELAGQARELGAHVISSPVPMHDKLAFARGLRGAVRDGGYEVLHCHHDIVSGFYLAATSGLPIRKRIVHVHNADEEVPTPNRLKAALLRKPMRHFCLSADCVVGISNHTLDTMLAGRARRVGRDLVHYYGVDPAPFTAASADRSGFRRSLGLEEDAQVLLFGGRVTPEKNPVFAVDVFASLLRAQPRAALVFAGAGSLEEAVRARAHELGVAGRTRMLGWRNDLPEIMTCADWFILPRPEEPLEGFGLAVVEAQLAGLRLLLSKGVADDPLLPTACERRLSLSDDPALWARAAVELWEGPSPSREAALAALGNSPMDMDFALEDLLRLHA